MQTIYVIRHGETDFNKEGIVQGSGVDSDLNEKGRRQGQAFFEKYQNIPFEVVCTSKLKRTHQTVQPFIEKGVLWEEFADINEICWGVHEGKKGTAESKQQYKDIMEAWEAGDYDARLENAESARDLATRLMKFIEHLRTRTEKNILVCAHGRAIRCLITLMLDQPLKNMQRIAHSNTGLYKMALEDKKYTLLLANDTSHLEGVKL